MSQEISASRWLFRVGLAGLTISGGIRFARDYVFPDDKCLSKTLTCKIDENLHTLTINSTGEFDPKLACLQLTTDPRCEIFLEPLTNHQPITIPANEDNKVIVNTDQNGIPIYKSLNDFKNAAEVGDSNIFLPFWKWLNYLGIPAALKALDLYIIYEKTKQDWEAKQRSKLKKSPPSSNSSKDWIPVEDVQFESTRKLHEYIPEIHDKIIQNKVLKIAHGLMESDRFKYGDSFKAHNFYEALKYVDDNFNNLPEISKIHDDAYSVWGPNALIAPALEKVHREISELTNEALNRSLIAGVSGVDEKYNSSRWDPGDIVDAE